MISSPSSVSTLLCLSVENKTEVAATFEPQINHQIIRKRPTQITKEKSQDATMFGLFNQQQLNKAVNELVRTLDVDETIQVVQQLENLVLKLNETMQPTISFKPFWNAESSSNDKICSALDSLMHLIGLDFHDGHYFSNDVEELIKKTQVIKELVQVFQKYYSPTNLETFKSSLCHCFNSYEPTNKGYMALKLKNMDDILEDMKINITDKNVSLTKGPTTLTGDFNLIYSQKKQDTDMNGFIDRIIAKVRKGDNIMLLSVGATGSGKSETFFKGIVSKRDQSEKPDEAIVLQMFEKLIDQEAQANKDTRIVRFECQYIQIFNENMFDLLKKKEEKEDLHEESKQTNLQWLKTSLENCTTLEITDKNSIRNIMKRASKNRALLTVQDKIFERRSTYLLKCQYKVVTNGLEKEAEIVFCELPGIEKLNQHEKDSLDRMNLPNDLLVSKTEFVDFWTKNYPTKKNSVLMKVLDPNFLRNCEMMIVSHVSLNRESFEETITLFRLLKHFNETISVHKKSKDQIGTDKDILSLLKKFDEIRALLGIHYSPSFSVQKATSSLKSIETLQESILSKCLRLSPVQLQQALQKIPELSNMSKLLETRPTVIPKPVFKKETKKNVPRSLNEIANISDTKRAVQQVIKSLSSPIGLQKTDNSKQKLAITQDPLYKYIDELVETDLDLYKVKLNTEGRCPVCTLKNCQRHSKTASKVEAEKTDPLASRPQERTENIAVKTSNRLASLSRPKEYNYDSENINPTPVKAGMQPYNPACTAKRKFRRAGSFQCEPVIVRDRNLDKSYNESEIKAKGLVNQSMACSLLEDQENCDKTRIEDMNGPKLAKQLKLEEYHEKKILENIRALKEKKIVEESQKKETEMQEEKKKKYFDNQKKRLDELRKLKVEDKKREKEEIEQKEIEELKKKIKNEQYYKNIKEKVMGYKQKRLAEILQAAEEITQNLEKNEEEEYESIFCANKEELKTQPAEVVPNKAPNSTQKEIQEEIPESPKHNETAEILEEEILEESITA